MFRSAYDPFFSSPYADPYANYAYHPRSAPRPRHMHQPVYDMDDEVPRGYSQYPQSWFGGREAPAQYTQARRPTNNNNAHAKQPHRQQRQQHPQSQPSAAPIPVAVAPASPPMRAAEKARLVQMAQLQAKARGRFAAKIQTWWRAVLARREESRRDEAARTIQHFFKHAVPNHRTKGFLKSLRALRTTETKIHAVSATFNDRFYGRVAGTSKDMPLFLDTMEKIIISLDGVNTQGGNEALRTERKRVVKVALDQIYRAEQLTAAARTLQTAWRARLQRRRDSLKPEAARTILRAIQTVRAKRDAAAVVAQLRELRHINDKIDALKAQFAKDLADLISKSGAAATQQSPAAHAIAARIAERAAGLHAAIQTL